MPSFLPHAREQVWLGVGMLAGVGVWRVVQRMLRTSSVRFTNAGRLVEATDEATAPAYEATLITAPQDERIVHLMRVVGAYQRVTPDISPALTAADWDGHWTLGSRNSDWTLFLSFLGVPAAAFEVASTGTDLHWYSVARDAFVFRHHIPAQQLDLRYKASLDGRWRLSPYAKPTSTHWSEEEAKKKGFKWRNRWLSYPTSMRCEWENKGGGEESGHGQPSAAEGVVTSITVMERHLVSKSLINFRVFVYPAGGDIDDESKYLVPAVGVTYLRVSNEPPLEPEVVA